MLNIGLNGFRCWPREEHDTKQRDRSNARAVDGVDAN